jgi:predicted DNA-binding protein with PD1-like motif
MDVQEKKIGRVFRASLKQGEDFFEEIYKLAEKEGIREASLFVIGALSAGRMITGFKNSEGDLDRRELGQKREFFAIGNLDWPSERPNAVPDTVPWEKPRPYAHFHLALGPDVGAIDPETLVGHLDKASIVGAFVDIYELL